MKKDNLKLILHPLRLKIVQIIEGREMTVSQINEEVPEVPAPTLYRHIKKLLEASVISIVKEIPIRGTVEKIYTLNTEAVNLTKDDLKTFSKEEHMQLFTSFTAALLSAYSEYLDSGDIDLERDGISYQQSSYYLSDRELISLLTEIKKTVDSIANNKPAPDRKLRSLSIITMPVSSGKGVTQ